MEYNSQKLTLIRLKKICHDYFRDGMETSIRSILLLISTAVLSSIVLYFYSILWHILRMTYSGRRFIMLHPKATNMIDNIVNNDLIDVSIHTTFSAFTICLIIGAICQVSYITRYLYYPQGIVAKLLCWGLPLTAVVSMYTNHQIEFVHWSYNMPLTIIPTLCLFNYCFKFTETLLPEFGDVIGKIFEGLKGLISLTSHQER